MTKPSFFVAFGDLIILFLYGGALCYTSTFIMPIEPNIQFVASSVLAFILGSLGPRLEEIVEWILFFSLGIIVASLAPQIQEYFVSGTYSLKQIITVCLQTLPYCIELLTGWIIGIPMGYLFYKVTHKNHYRQPRFY